MATVLIVDDDDTIGAALSEELAAEGFSTFYAGSAEEALDMVFSKTIDIMLLDLKMPGKDGFYVMQTLRGTLPNVKIIVLSAYADVKSAMEAAQLGASEFFQKPFDFAELIATIKKLTLSK